MTVMCAKVFSFRRDVLQDSVRDLAGAPTGPVTLPPQFILCDELSMKFSGVHQNQGCIG